MVPSDRRRRSTLLPVTLAALALVGTMQIFLRSTAFVPEEPPKLNRARTPPRLAGVKGETMKAGKALQHRWQQGIDTVFLDIDATLEERIAGLRDILLRPGAVAASLRDAIFHVADQGVTRGYPKAFDSLFPKGTLLRSDLEGMLSLVRQVPEVFTDILSSGAIALPAADSVPDTEESLEYARAALTKVLSPQGVNGAVDAAFDGLRRTPKLLQEPEFELVGSFDDFDVRRYPKFTLATRTADGIRPVDGWSSADPFSAMTSHMMKSKQLNMNLYTPMHIRYNIRDMEPLSVSYFVPRGMTVTNRDMQVTQVSERLMAIRQFPGIATVDEVKRQYEALLRSLAERQIYEPHSPGYFSVIQYNPPYTIPWRRRNEIAVEVRYNAANAAVSRRVDDRQFV